MQVSVEHPPCARSVGNNIIHCCTRRLTPNRKQGGAILMTCKVKVTASDGSVTQARVLLHVYCAASTSLVTERLVQMLRLPRRHSNFTINGVAGCNVLPKGSVSFKVAGAGGRGGGSRSRWKPLYFPRSRLIYPPFPFLQLPSGNTCWD